MTLLTLRLVLAAVVAAVGSDDVLYAVHGAAMAARANLVCQRGVLMAWPHAHAGLLTLA